MSEEILEPDSIRDTVVLMYPGDTITFREVCPFCYHDLISHTMTRGYGCRRDNRDLPGEKCECKRRYHRAENPDTHMLYCNDLRKCAFFDGEPLFLEQRLRQVKRKWADKILKKLEKQHR